MKSMTGYGIAELNNDNVKFKIEIKSVNHKFLDLNIKYPHTLLAKDFAIRNIIKKYIKRGKVDVFIKLFNMNENINNLDINLKLAEFYYNSYKKIKEHLNLKDEIKLIDIYKSEGVIEHNDENNPEDYWDILNETLNEALNNCLDMRIREGLNLKNDILLKLEKIKNLNENLKIIAPIALNNSINKLKEFINNEISSENIDNARLTTEIIIMTDKLSIDEEITRIFSHIENFKIIMNSNDPVGRKLDFLTQELNREVNTIGSKTNDLEILNSVIELKSEIEKIREQIQNIE